MGIDTMKLKDYLLQSFLLSGALYDCDWTSKSRRFKRNMLLFVERTNRPLTIIGYKMFPLSLQTFSSVSRIESLDFTVIIIRQY